MKNPWPKKTRPDGTSGVPMTDKHTPARVAPLALIISLLLAGLYVICEYYNVPFKLIVIFEVILIVLSVFSMQRAFRPGGWMNKED